MQSDTKKRRGRPRAFSSEKVLKQALEVFWERGFEATTLDHLCAATGLNRPSLYGAFGDKEELYLAVLQVWSEEMRQELTSALRSADTVKSALGEFYRAAIHRYTAGGARGCMVVCTAPSTVEEFPSVRKAYAEILRQLDEGLEQYFRTALPEEPQPAALARLAAAAQHSLALRARAGATATELQRLADDFVDLLLPQGAKRNSST